MRPWLRQVKAASPLAYVDLWALDEHRIGLKPNSRKAWTFNGQRPIAPVQHRYKWRYFTGSVHLGSGRTLCHIENSASIEFFSASPQAFARQRGQAPPIDPTKQIVLALDRASSHTSPKLRVPEHIHLLFLPAFSPELQPAEHLWARSDTALVNRHFATNSEADRAILPISSPLA